MMIHNLHHMRPGDVFSPVDNPEVALALVIAEGAPVADGSKYLWTVVVDTRNTDRKPGQLTKLPRCEQVRMLQLRSPALYEAR